MRAIWTATTPRGRLVAGLGGLTLVAGLAWRYPVLAALGGCLAGLVVVDLVVVLRAPRLEVRRALAPRVVVRHGSCQGTLHVSGARPGALARLEAFDLVDGVPVAVPLAADPRAVATSVTYTVPTPRRGLMVVGPAVLRRHGLVGLAVRTDEAGTADEVRVLPRPVPLAGLPAGHRRALSGGDDSVEQGGTDLVGLHEYGLGDDLRRLHWATSARTGRLMVREDAEPSEAHLLVLLDDRSGSYPTGDLDLFEEAVEFAAGLCQVGLDSGSPVRFGTASGRYDVVIAGSTTRQPRREARELEWLLAEIQPVASEHAPRTGARDLDIAVAVGGPDADHRSLVLPLAGAPTRVLAVVDPVPGASVADEAGALVLAGRTAGELAAAWDGGVGG